METQTLRASPALPRSKKMMVPMAAPASFAAQQYRLLAHRLERFAATRPMRVIAVTSSTRDEGRTTTAANLALTTAIEGRNTILVEGDLRRPALADFLGLVPRAGLGQVLDGSCSLGQAICRVGPLSVLTAGEVRDPVRALRNPRLLPIFEQLRAAHAFVVLDAPPALAFSDSRPLSSATDGVVMVVRAGSTPRQVVRMAIEALGDKVLGMVLNDVESGLTMHRRYFHASSGAA